MTLFPAAVLAAAGAGAKPVLRVSTKYMETFLPVRPVSSGTEIHSFVNEAGVIDLYSVGSDAQVHRLRRGQGQSAPYDDTPLAVAATQLYLFTPAGGSADTPWIFGLDPTGKLTLSRWQDGAGYVQQVTEPAKATDTIRRLLGVRGNSGRIYINVRLDDGRLGTNYYDLAAGRWGGDVWAPVKGPDGNPAMVKDIAVAANNPVQSALFAIGQDDEVLFAEDSFRTSQLRKLNRKVSRIGAVTDADNLLCLFAVDLQSGELWLKKQRKYSTGSGIQFEDWLRIDAAPGTRFTDIRANLRFDGRVEVFAADQNGDLHYSRQGGAPGGKPAGWSMLFPIAAGAGGAIFTTGRNRSGYSEAYSVSRQAEITRFWQSPESGQWFTETLEVPEGGDTLASVPTHAAEVTAVDDRGLPLGHAEIVVNTTFLTTLWVNGAAYRASLLDPVKIKTGLDGKLVLHQRATALAAATLLVQTPATPAGGPLKVEPNAALQDHLGGMGKQQVLDAKDRSGQLLLPADMKDRDAAAESIAEVTRRSMEIAKADEAGGGALQYRFAGARHAGFRPGLDLSALGDTAWEIDFSAGYPRYRDIGVAEALAYRASRADASLGGFLGIDWGSVWSAFKRGVEWVVNGISKIVVTIVNGIGKVLFEIAGKVFEAIIEVAQQAFDFVEGVWNWLKVKLEQLYEWLAFLFNFKNYARTAEGIEHSIGVVLDFTADAVLLIRDRVGAGFDTIKDNLKSIVDDLIQQLGPDGGPSLGGYLGEHSLPDGQSYATDHNLFLNAFQENQGRIRSLAGGAGDVRASTALSGGLSTLLERLQGLADNFQFGDGKQAFDEAFGYFDAIGSDPGRVLELLLSGLIKVLEGVALFALDAAKGVVLTMLDLVADMVQLFREGLFEDWEIPVLSQLYKLFTGSSLTIRPVSVVAWIAAIPTTILSKVILDRAPFPDDAALDRFKATFTVDWLKQRAGIGGARPAALVQDDSFDTELRHNFLVAYTATMALRTLIDLSQIGANATGAGLGPAAIVPVALRFGSTLFTMPWAMSPQAGAPSCTPGEPGFAVTIWICQILLGPTRGALIVKSPWGDAKTKIYVGELTLTLWGVANVIMTTWNFVASKREKDDALNYARTMGNILPGQALRFMAVPALNQGAYYIPAGILAALTAVGYIGSAAIAGIQAGQSSEVLIPDLRRATA